MKREYWRYLRVVVPYLKRHKGLAALSILLMAFGTLAALAQPWPFAFLIDSVLGDEAAPGVVTNIVGASQNDLIVFAVIASIGVVVFASVIGVIDTYVNTRLEQEMALEFRSDLFAHCQQLSQSYHDQRAVGDFIYRINFEAHHVGAVAVAIPTLIQNAVTVLAMLAITYRISPTLALLSLAVVPFVYLSIGTYGKHVEPRLIRVRNLEGLSLTIVHEVFSRLKVVVAFNRQDHESKRFQRQGTDAVRERVGVTLMQTVFNLGVGFITAIGTGLIIGVGAHEVLNQQLSVGQLMVVMAYVASIYQPLQSISSTLGEFQNHFVALRFASELLSLKPDVVDAPDARPLDHVAGAVAVEDVTFDYPTRKGTLQHISFQVEPGEVVAVVGPTGAGKSTLVNLLMRFYDPSAGRILVDGNDIREVTQATLRENISLVLQDPLLLGGTVADNIRYGKLDASDDEIIAAARAANAHDFVMQLPHGYDTPLGEGGARLSGGERQRLCIARAFVKSAPILILDEPTSSIDSRTESVILDALDRLMIGRTTFVVAHRLSTVRHANKILVIDKGQLVEHGTHEELLGRNGLYRALHDVQTGERRVARTRVPNGARNAEPASGTPAPGNGHRVSVGRRPRVVVLGMMTKIPVPGVVWQTGHYLAGLERLGFEVYYVEAHARTPSMLAPGPAEGVSETAARFIEKVMSRFGLEHRWAFHALHDDGRCYGMSHQELIRLYRSAALVLNLHGGTRVLPEHIAGGTLVYLETDPVTLQVELASQRADVIEMLEPHAAFFTFAENLGNPDCRLPVSDRFAFRPTRQPVVMDFWQHGSAPSTDLTTIGNWRQPWRDVDFDGETYFWTKDLEFEKFIDLPSRTSQSFELALASYGPEDEAHLRAHGWNVRAASEAVPDPDSYRSYVTSSRGEFTVAKDQNVRLRSGWFSDRSATYLAAGRPVATQDTGFPNVLPTGSGLFAFTSIDDATAAVEALNADYRTHSETARDIAREFFAHDRVLTPILDHVGLSPARQRFGLLPRTAALPDDLVLVPESKRPLRLPPDTVDAVLRRPIPTPRHRGSVALGPKHAASIIVVTHNNLVLTRLCLESVLTHTQLPRFEIVVVDNASTDGTRAYLEQLAAEFPRITLQCNDHNTGFAHAVNQGLGIATGRTLAVLNNDVIVTPGWLTGLMHHLDDPEVGLVGPVTNAAPNEARVQTTYRTIGEMLEHADAHRRRLADVAVELPMVTMFCIAMRRGVYDQIGPLDERFGLGQFEDDDYSLRVRKAGFRIVCAQDVFVHHFGEGSFGDLVPSGEYGVLFDENRKRFESKWNVHWQPHDRRPSAEYEAVKADVHRVARDLGLPWRQVLVISNGDEDLVRLDGTAARHFPEAPDGGYAGHHPADSAEAIRNLDALREQGVRYLVFPATATWWLDHYTGLREHLGEHATEVHHGETCRVFALSALALQTPRSTDGEERP